MPRNKKLHVEILPPPVKAEKRERDLWFWMKEVGAVLAGTTDGELAAMRQEYLNSGSELVITVGRRPARKGHVSVMATLRLERPRP